MKQVYFFILVSGVFSSCGKKCPSTPAHATQVVTIYNVSRQYAPFHMSEQVQSLFNFNIDKDQQADFRIVLLHGTLLNAAQSIHMDGFYNRSQATSEEIENHAQMVNSFCNSVRTAVTDFPKQYGAGKYPPRIETWATVAQELEPLAVSRASQRAMVFYGSLAECEPGFSSSSYEGSQLLQSNPEKVVGLLEKRHKLPGNLVGISIFFVFPIMNELQARENANMLSIYQTQLRERGARVIIQSANNPLEL